MSRPKARILIVDDEPAMLEACEETLRYHGYDVSLRDTPDGGIAAVREQTFDLMLLDLKMPDKDGLEVLEELRSIDANLVKIMVTAFPTISTAVEAVKQGAFDYLPKPFSPDQLLITVDRALAQKRLTTENEMLRRALKFRRGFDGIVARSAAMEKVMDLVQRLADSDSSILILGETGTGKELIARSIHDNSKRSDAPFLPIDCGAMPDQLLESELFGHERGAFTGAFTRKTGLLEAVQGGTVFLDEIATLSVELQVKLLRVIQERQLRRVGGTETLDIDMRLLSATNEDLDKAMAEGRFRQDLYYRLNVLTISLPPLRERAGDVPLLADHFVKELNEAATRKVDGIAPEAMKALVQYDWPGNVREIHNAIEGAFFLTDSGSITLASLPAAIATQAAVANTAGGDDGDTTLAAAKARFERDYLSGLLTATQGNVSRAAAQAGLHRTSFQRLLRKHDIQSEEYRIR